MPSLASARTPRDSERGSVNWAFVITLFLLLGMVFMWWTAADERDQNAKKRDDFKKEYDKLSAESQLVADDADKTAKFIGFLSSKPLPYKGGTVATVDRALVEGHLTRNGEVEIPTPDPSDDPNAKVKVPGMLNMLMNSLKVKILAAARSGDAKEPTTKEVDFTWLSQKFRDKLKQVNDLFKAIPGKPEAPADSDDTVAATKYQAELASYNTAVEAYQAANNQLNGEEFKAEVKQYRQVIAGMPFDPDGSKALELNFAPKLIGDDVKTLEDLFPLFGPPYQNLLAEFKANKETDMGVIAKLNGEKGGLGTTLEEEKKRFTDLQTTAQAELQRAKEENGKLEQQRAAMEQEKTQAANSLKVMTDEFKKSTAKSKAETAALQARVASDKEHAELQIRRDEVDGTLLSVSGVTGTGTISLGSMAKLSPGIKFAVSFVDRGGDRQTVGQVQVIKVTGPYSSEVRVLDSTQPLVSGLLISNPLFNANRAIHVYPLGWTPDLIQGRRLADMNVIVDKVPTADTDYFVVPDDWKGGVTAPTAEGGAAPAASQLEKARLEAGTFGATVITFRMLDSFLRL